MKPSQHLAIIALLTGSTISGAAQRAGVTERTMYRWLAQPEFMDALHQEERQVLDGVGWRLVSMSRLALDALNSVLVDPAQPGAANKRQAAVAVLELLMKWRSMLDFEDRLKYLERLVSSEWE